MNELALFAGVGGGLLATHHILGWRCACAVEKASYRREVLLRRQRDGLLPLFPIWDDARTFDGRPWRGIVDVITAGFPCQPFSVAGKQLAGDDERNLWPETIRIIQDVAPEFVFLENVPGLVYSGYVLTVLDDLAQSGYTVFPPIWCAASDVGANHRRRRVWIVAYTSRQRAPATEQPECRRGAEQGSTADVFRRRGGTTGATEQEAADTDRCSQAVAHSECQRLERPAKHGLDTEQLAESSRNVPNSNGQGWEEQRPIRGEKEVAHPEPHGNWRAWWEVEPKMGRVAHGVAYRVECIEAIGDGQVPAVVAAVWLATQRIYMMGHDNDDRRMVLQRYLGVEL